MPRSDPDELQGIAQNEYNRRGKTAQRTRWGPDEILRFVRHRLAHLKPGMDVGVYAYQLPESQGGAPAPMPKEVVAWEQSGAERPESEEEAEEAQPETYKADDAYEFFEDRLT